jgi:hypothetical protein
MQNASDASVSVIHKLYDAGCGVKPKVVKWYTQGDVKGKTIPLEALTGPGGSRRLRVPDFKTIST